MMKNMKYIIVFNNQHACTQIKITLTRLSCMITWSMITMSMVFHLRCCICIICWAGIVHPMSTLEYSTGGYLWIYGTIYILFQTWIKENTRDFLFHIEVFSSFLNYGTTKFFCIFILLYKTTKYCWLLVDFIHHGFLDQNAGISEKFLLYRGLTIICS